MSTTSESDSARSSDANGREVQAVPPAKPRRHRVQRRELAFIIGIVVVLVGLFLPRQFPVEVTHYRCIVCGAIATERKIRQEAILGETIATDESRVYESMALAPHRHRWSKGTDTFFKDRLSGEVYAAASRDVSPVWGLRGDDFRKLLEVRVARDGSLAPLEAELHVVEETFLRHGSSAAKEQMRSIWREIPPP